MALACIARKSLEIWERCRLRQQNPPASRDNSAAVFYGKICNNLFIELFQKMAVNQARKRLD
jgi:hypothetical protein